jgi:hypothetical protein
MTFRNPMLLSSYCMFKKLLSLKAGANMVSLNTMTEIDSFVRSSETPQFIWSHLGRNCTLQADTICLRIRAQSISHHLTTECFLISGLPPFILWFSLKEIVFICQLTGGTSMIQHQSSIWQSHSGTMQPLTGSM